MIMEIVFILFMVVQMKMPVIIILMLQMMMLLASFQEIYYDCDGNCINDRDFDQICDEVDNCIEDSNPDQEDIDNDGEGDACDYDDGIGIDEISENTPTVIKMVDVLGREQQEHKKGSILFYIYDNGKVEKRIIH